MTEIEIMGAMNRGEITDEQAIEKLVDLGYLPGDAGEMVALEKYGTDIFEVDEKTGEITPAKF